MKQIKSDEVLQSVDGKSYTILENGNVKKVKSKKSGVLSEFVKNNSVHDLEREQEIDNTHALYLFLKDKTEDLQYDKRGIVKWRGFNICYRSHGFKITDSWNYGEVLNANKFNNDYAFPEDLLNFIIKEKNRLLLPPKADRDKVEMLKKLEKRFKVEKPADLKVIEREGKVQEVHINAKMRIEKLIDGKKSKIMDNVSQTLKQLKKRKMPYLQAKALFNRISQRVDYRDEITKLLRSFLKNKIKFQLFEKQITTLVEGALNPKEIAPKKAPKFVGVELWEPSHFEKHNNKIRFYQKGAEKQYVVETTVVGFLVNQVLGHFPKAMQLLMEFAQGNYFIDEEIDWDRFYRNPFISYNKKVMANPVNPVMLELLCKEILWYNQTSTALDYIFPEEFERIFKAKPTPGKEIEVYLPHENGWAICEICDEPEKGIFIDYDGNPIHLSRKYSVRNVSPIK